MNLHDLDVLMLQEFASRRSGGLVPPWAACPLVREELNPSRPRLRYSCAQALAWLRLTVVQCVGLLLR